MLSRNKDIFVRSSYWGTWSRVLLRMGGQYNYQIEVDVTPVNDQFKFSWEQTKQIRIRKHMTAQAPRDIYTHHLPDNVVELMKEHLSQETVDIILHSDIYNLVDWEKYEDVRTKGGGGVQLLDCIKTITPIFRLGYINDKGGDIINGDKESFTNKLKEDFGKELSPKERLITGWMEIQTKGTICVYITSDVETDVYTTHFIAKEGNEQWYTNALMLKYPSDWLVEIKPLITQLLGNKLEDLGIVNEIETYVDQVKLILEYDVLWGLV